MDQVGSSRITVDLDIDLESGGEGVRKGQVLSDENSTISGKFMSSESSRGSTDARYFSSSENLSSAEEIYYKSKEMQLVKFGQETENSVDRTSDKKNRKQPRSARPPRPHRPPNGPPLGAYDMKLLKEIAELNSRRRRMARIRAMNKTKMKKASSLKSSLLACSVTIIFILVIVLQGLLGSRV